MDTIVGLIRRFPFIVLIVVIVVGGLIFREYLAGAASDLRVGDCFDEPAEVRAGQTAVEVRDVQHRPCADPHDGEVIAVLTHPADRQAAYLSEDAVLAYITDQCVPAFQAYTGRGFSADPDHDIGWFYPTNASWTDGDRGFSCYIYRIDGAKITGTQRLTQ